jgi:putative transposase
MARLPRLVLANQPHHIIQRGNNRQHIYVDQLDYQQFLLYLRDAAKQFKVAIHAYVLMPNHVHLLASPSDTTGLAKMMQWVGRKYVPYFNHKYQRSGTLFQGRFITSVIDSEAYFLRCMRYIEWNPVRAQLSERPEDYDWSSARHHIGARPDGLIIDHAIFWALGNTPFQREAAYVEFLGAGEGSKGVAEINAAVLRGWPLGSDHYKQLLEQRAKRQVLPAKRGRPPKPKDCVPN